MTTPDPAPSERAASLNLDHDEARAVHRIVRAIHDGECPKCRSLHLATEMWTERIVFDGKQQLVSGWQCPQCGFFVTEAEGMDAIAAQGLSEDLAAFRRWRTLRVVQAAPDREDWRVAKPLELSPIAPTQPADTTPAPDDGSSEEEAAYRAGEAYRAACTYTHDPKMVICMKCGWTPASIEQASHDAHGQGDYLTSAEYLVELKAERELPDGVGPWKRENIWWYAWLSDVPSDSGKGGSDQLFVRKLDGFNSPPPMLAVNAPKGGWTRAVPASSLAELKEQLAEVQREGERLASENKDYRIGAQYNAKRLTELGAKIGLSGQAYVHFGWGGVGDAITAAQSRIRELEAMQNQQQPEPRCGFCGTKLTLVRPGSHQCDNPECESNQ